jgi:uncharacterized protein
MNLLKIILSTSAFAIASVALHAQLPTKVESFPVIVKAFNTEP